MTGKSEPGRRQQLAKAIDLAGNASTPQHAHAIELKGINDERLQVVARCRSVMPVRHTLTRKLDPPADEKNPETAKDKP